MCIYWATQNALRNMKAATEFSLGFHPELHLSITNIVRRQILEWKSATQKNDPQNEYYTPFAENQDIIW